MNIVFDVKYLNEKVANADIELTLDIPLGVLATIYWADENGTPLEDYLPIKSIPLIDGKSVYRCENSLFIPENAKKIRCRVWSDAMIEIPLPELIKDIPESKRVSLGRPIKKIIATSDIHLGGEYFNNTANRISTFKYIKEAKPDFLIVAGDITDNSNPSEFDSAKELVETLDGIPAFFSTGNHDLAPYKAGCFPHYDEMNEFFSYQRQRSIDLGAEVSEIHFPKYYYSARIGGVHVIVLDACNEKNAFYLGDEQLKWLEEELCKSDGEPYRFVVTHFHQKNTVAVIESCRNRSYFKENDEVQAILDRHKNVIHTSGHSHYNYDSDVANGLVDEKHGNIYLNTGCGVWNDVGHDERGEYYIKNRATGQLIEIYSDRIVCRGVDFVSGKFIPRCQHSYEIK